MSKKQYEPLLIPPGAKKFGGVEVLRAGVAEQNLTMSIRRAFDDPANWGVLLATAGRQVARIYATEAGLKEDEVRAVLAGEGEDVKAAAAGAKAGAGPPAAASKPSQAAEAPTKSASTPAPSPQPSPQRGEGVPAPRPQPSAPAMPRTNGAPAGRIFSSPLARRLAREAGIDLGRVQGTGPHGRVVARDIEAAKSGTGLRPPGLAAPGTAPAAAPMAVRAPSDEKIRALFEPGSYEVVPHDNMRKIIAQRLTESKLTIPHFYLTIDCTLDKLLSAREEIKA